MSVSHPNRQSLAGWWFFTSQDKILCVPQGQRIPFGQIDDLPVAESWLTQAEYFNDYMGEPCYRLALDEPIDLGLGEWITLYQLVSDLDEAFFLLAGQAMQQALFLKTHQFCGQCGQPMARVEWEFAMQCEHCGFRAYPRISPCIIVAIRKENSILLACHKRHVKKDNPIYTAVAGFVETGETLEHCVQREAFEETGIHVDNIRYAGSQPWPFPHSLMMAFLADYQSGEIKVQRSELVDANWFEITNLPQLPKHGTIARKIIDTLVSKISQELKG